jgi:hypothetical protein
VPRDEIEQSIREALATEASAIALSHKLLHPDGLFAKLATTEQERRALTRSALFVGALRRLSDLQSGSGRVRPCHRFGGGRVVDEP